MTDQQWTEKDDTELEKLLLSYGSISKVAEVMGRLEDDVLNRCYKLDLIPRHPHPF